jgi:hypothetical protein
MGGAQRSKRGRRETQRLTELAGQGERGHALEQRTGSRAAMGAWKCHRWVPVPNDSRSTRSVIAGLLVVIGSIGGVALLVWFTVVLLDLKHLNTSGFTLP